MAPKPDASTSRPRSKAVTKSKPADLLSWVNILLAVVVVLAAVGWTFRSQLQTLWALHIRPPPNVVGLSASKLVELPELSSAAYRNEMLWGSYRSGLYFGMRTRAPKSLLIGLMWFDPDDVDTINQHKIRHSASQNDGLATYGWLRHDGVSYGRQSLIDGNYNITVTMVKDAEATGSGFGGDWAVRVSVTRAANGAPSLSRSGAPRKQRRISVLVYIADEGTPQGAWRMLPNGEPHEDDLHSGFEAVSGTDAVVGPWKLHARAHQGASRTKVEANKQRPWRGRLDYMGMQMDKKDYIVHLRELLVSLLYQTIQRFPQHDSLSMYLPNGVNTQADLAMFQFSFALPGTCEWTFTTGAAAGDGPDADEASSRQLQRLSGNGLTELIQEREAAYEERYERTFGRAAQATEAGGRAAAESEMAKAALSNLLGSMGYFYGSSQIRTASGVRAGRPAALFTAVPSRSFFPRGFLWDEGFHQLLVQRWDPRTSRDALAHWLDLMNHEGWIPREQILGAEAESRVPDEYIVQDPQAANPPSLYLPISNMAAELQSKGADGAPEMHAFLQRAWPRLQAWYGWFNRTQAGQLPGTYRWHGRNATTTQELNPKTLTSGLDDYPRASHPTDEERHLDLRCWMAMASDAMATIGESLGVEASSVARYRQTATLLADVASLDRLHLDPATGQYLDWGLHSEDVVLQRKTVVENGEAKDVVLPRYPVMRNGKAKEISVRQVSTPPTVRLVPGFGYVSLFPLLMCLLPPSSEQLGHQLSLLAKPQLLWSPSGLRSLATDAPLYRKHNTLHDPPYWRGQIWMNINYLALRALDHYAGQEGPHRAAAAELHRRLKSALLTTVVDGYTHGGYLYEQYDDMTGQGLSSHPFTGWTALAALIAVDAY